MQRGSGRSWPACARACPSSWPRRQGVWGALTRFRLGGTFVGRTVVRPSRRSARSCLVLVPLLPGIPLSAPARPAASSLERVQGAGDRRSSPSAGGTSPADTPSPTDDDRSSPPGCSEPVAAAFALAGDLDADNIVSNTFDLEWPPRSGRTQSFPEVDRAAWFDLDTARRKIVKSQQAFLDRL